MSNTVQPQDEDPREKLSAAMTDAIESPLAKAEKAMEGPLRGLDDQARSIVTLSSAFFALSVSAAQFVSNKLPLLQWGWLLPVSWVLFAAAVVLGAWRYTFSAKALAGRLLLMGELSDADDRIRALPIDDKLGTNAVAIFNEHFDRAWGGMVQAVDNADKVGAAMFWSLAGGIVALLVFAIRNLPF